MGNQLSVGSATLADDASSSPHTIVVDHGTVTGDGNTRSGLVTVSQRSTIGTLEVQANGQAILAAAGTAVSNITIDSSGAVHGGAVRVDDSATIGSVTNQNGLVEFESSSGTSVVDKFQLASDSYIGSPGTVRVLSGATVNVQESSSIQTLDISADAELALQSRSMSPSSS